MTRRATFTEAELARAIGAADKAGKVALQTRAAVMGTNEDGTMARAADHVGKSARK